MNYNFKKTKFVKTLKINFLQKTNNKTIADSTYFLVSNVKQPEQIGTNIYINVLKNKHFKNILFLS